MRNKWLSSPKLSRRSDLFGSSQPIDESPIKMSRGWHLQPLASRSPQHKRKHNDFNSEASLTYLDLFYNSLIYYIFWLYMHLIAWWFVKIFSVINWFLTIFKLYFFLTAQFQTKKLDFFSLIICTPFFLLFWSLLIFLNPWFYFHKL